MVLVLGGRGVVVFFGMSTALFGHGRSIDPFLIKLPISELNIYAGGTEQVAKQSTSSWHNPALVPLLTSIHLGATYR